MTGCIRALPRPVVYPTATAAGSVARYRERVAAGSCVAGSATSILVPAGSSFDGTCITARPPPSSERASTTLGMLPCEVRPAAAALPAEQFRRHGSPPASP